MMKIFKQELEYMLRLAKKEYEDIDYAFVVWREWGENKKTILLKKSGEELIKCSDYDSFKYDDDYGIQEVFGYIVFKDGAWIERVEYDGSEWWQYKKIPTWEEIKKEILEDDC